MALFNSYPLGQGILEEKSSLRKQFGIHLKHMRLQRARTQEQIAEAAGVSVDLISNIERGINAPSFETLEKLACALDTSVEDLFAFKK